MLKKYEMNLAGRPLTIENGRVAHQANGAVTVQYGNTMVLAAVTANKEVREGADFLPLTVDVVEKAYAAGKLPGGFFKREGRPSTEGILACRLVDRPLSPLLTKSFYNEVQVIVTVLSSDGENPHPILDIIAASAALTISDIPFEDPIGATVIGLIEGELVVNPTYEELGKSDLELTVAGNGNSTMMVEAGAKFVSEEIMLEALGLAQEVNGEISELISDMKKEIGNKKWDIPDLTKEQKDAKKATIEAVGEQIKDVLYNPKNKQSRNDQIKEIMKTGIDDLSDKYDPILIRDTLYDIEKKTVREAILKDSHRPDGRDLTEIRSLVSEIGYLPMVHGSGLFTRGETQILGVLTLASSGEAQNLDSYSPETNKFFIHHYNFPPYSAGETGRFGFTGRREIGHGKLAWRAIRPLLPNKEDFPYTIRVVSEVTESNGSSSMATVCGTSMSMMDSGVPLGQPCAGIAMGLIKEGDRFAVLSDILGDEDHLGDMDFKVAGTSTGITSLQMDIKITSITEEIMKVDLEQAREGRLHILAEMEKAIGQGRETVSDNAPRVTTLSINKEKIRDVIGPGGKIIREICEATGAKIDIDDNVTIKVAAVYNDAGQAAIDWIKSIVAEPELGVIYNGKVVKTVDFGAFVNFLGPRDGLVHISELLPGRVNKTTDVVKVDDEVKVKVIGFDDRGKVKLSMRLVDQETGAVLEPDE